MKKSLVFKVFLTMLTSCGKLFKSNQDTDTFIFRKNKQKTP